MRRVVWTVLQTLIVSSLVYADGSSGTWTGAVKTRGNYYWERSTRVIAPSFDVTVESPIGLTVQADYLIDSITSASLATGTVVDEAFTEIRHQVGNTISYSFESREIPVDTGVRWQYSNEPDYESITASSFASVHLNQRATSIRAGLSYVHDDVARLVRGVQQEGDQADQRNRESVGTLESVVWTVSWDQVLSQTLTFKLGYDFSYLWGFLANPYRTVSIAGVSQNETHPEVRQRNSLHARLSYYIPKSKTSLQALLRGYADTWGIVAINPEARVYQEILDVLMIRARYRYYIQSASSFSKKQYTIADSFFTADPKMTAFHSHLLGGQLWFPCGFLEDTPLDFLHEATIDINAEYIWNTNRFGNGVIAQIGMKAPF